MQRIDRKSQLDISQVPYRRLPNFKEVKIQFYQNDHLKLWERGVLYLIPQCILTLLTNFYFDLGIKSSLFLKFTCSDVIKCLL